MKRAALELLQRLHLYGPAKAVGRGLQALLPAARHQRRRMREFYAQFIRPGDLCFDVGANLGDRTAVFLGLGARVVAVEPQAHCRERLQHRFRNLPQMVLVPKALGERTGELVMNVSNAETISSLSPDWIASVKASGRFAGHTWDRTETVAVTTLDDLIREFGQPAFCKVDVEGYEEQVFLGLTQPLRVASFEFTPEFLRPALRSAQRLAGLGGEVRFNYSLGESMRLELNDWVTADVLAEKLAALPDASVFGDVYTRFE